MRGGIKLRSIKTISDSTDEKAPAESHYEKRRCKDKLVACGDDVCPNCVCTECDFSCENIIDGKCCLCRGDPGNKDCELEHCEDFKEDDF